VRDQPLLSTLGRLADVVSVSWVLAGLYLYVFGWTYATALLNAWGVTPEDIGYDSLWLVARTAVVFAVFLGFTFAIRAGLGGVRGRDAWAYVLSWAGLALALARTSYSVVDMHIALVVLGSAALAAPFAAVADRLAGGDGRLLGRRWPIVGLSVASLLYLSLYAGRLGEDYRAESTNGPVVIVFFPFKGVPSEWLNLVKIEFPLVGVRSAGGDDLGCGLLLRTHGGVHYVYDRDSVYRFPVDGFVVRDLRYDFSGHCDALDLVPDEDEPPEPTPEPTPTSTPTTTPTTTPPPG